MGNSLRLRLTIIFIGLATVPLLIVILLVAQRNFSALSEQAINLQSEIAQRVAKDVSNLINSRETELTLLTGARNILQLEKEDQINILSGLLANQQTYEEVSLLDNEGQEIVRIGSLKVFPDEELNSRVTLPEFEEPRATGQIYYSPVQFNATTGEPFMIVAVPSYDVRSGAFNGVLAANFRFRSIWDLMSSSRLPGGGIVYLVDAENRVVAHRDPSVVLQDTRIDLPGESGFFPGLASENAAIASASDTFGGQTFRTVAELQRNEALALPISNVVLTAGVMLMALVAASLISVLAARQIVRPIENLAVTSEAIAAGDLTQVVQVKGRDEIGTLAASFNRMTSQLRMLIGSLEQRVYERTRDLALASEVGRAISQIRDLDELLQQAVVLIQERFDLYYTQIYLMDEDKQRLTLRAGTGVAGQTLLAQGHSLPVDEYSLNGRAAAHQEAVIVADTQTNDSFRPNPVLPDTRSEMSVPLLVQDQVVGVIDLQSERPNALSEDNLAAFTILGGQLAVAIENARLFQTESALAREMVETTSFLDSVVESLPLMLFVKEAESLNFVRWNQTSEQLTGFSKESLIGKNDYDFFPQEEADYYTAKDREVLANGLLVDIPEEPIHTAHQGTRLLHTTKVPIFGADGKARYLLGISEDITERKQMERQLAERLKQLNLLNEIGRKAEEVSDLVQFMDWVTERVPQTMEYSDNCIVSITLDDETYGDAQAMACPRHIVEELRIRDQLVGRIVIAYTDTTLDFRDEDSALIGSVGRRISAYIENQRLLSQMHLQAENLQKVTEISTAVAAIHNPYQLTQEAAELTQKQFNLYQTALFTRQEDELILVGAAGALNEQLLGQELRISLHSPRSLIARAGRTQQGILVNDVTAEPDFAPHPLLPDTRAEIVVPLVVGGQMLGVLDIQSDQQDGFTVEDLNIFTTLASQIAVTLQNVRQYQQTQETLEELNSLQRAMTGESWEAFMTAHERSVQGYLASREAVQPIMSDADTPSNGSATPRRDLAQDEKVYMAPVQIRGTTIGKIGVRHTTETAISSENQTILDAISRQVADALERARLLEETEVGRQQLDTRARQLAAINQVAQTVSQQLDIEKVLATVHQQIAQVMKTDAFSVGRYDAPADILSYLYLYDSDQRHEEPPGPLDRESLSYQVISTGLPLLKNYTPAEHQELLALETTPTIGVARLPASLMFAPLVAGTQAVGVISVQSYEHDAYSENDLTLLLGIANHMAVALENARLFAQTQEALAETQKRTEELALVNQVVTQLGASLDIQQAMQIVAQGLVEGAGVDQARIALMDARHQTLTIVAEHFDPEKSTSALGLQIPIEGNELTQHVLRTRQPVVIADALNHPLTEPIHEMLAEQKIQAMAVLPMLVGNEVIGTVGIDLLGAGAVVTEDALRLAETIVLQAATAIQNARLFAKTEEALAEVQALFNVSAQLNAATTLTEVVLAASAPGLADGAYVASLFKFEPGESGAPEWAELVSSTQAGSVMPLGMRLHIPSLPFGHLWLSADENVLLMEDIAHDDRLDPASRALLEQTNTSAMVLITLAVGARQIGEITIVWGEPHEFTEADQRLYTSIAGQAASVVDSILLLDEVQKRATELQETTGFLDSVVENLPVMLFVKDAEDLRFVRWNKAGSDITGRPQETFIGKTDYDFFPEEVAEFSMAKDREVLNSGETLEIPDEPIQTVHQGTRILHTRKVPIHDAEGKPKYLLGISEDITERRQFEETLAKRALELQMVAEISTAVASNLDVTRLLQDVVDLARDNFDLYHAHIYLMNEQVDTLVLSAGAGQAGAQMVAEGHAIPLNSEQSLVARAARLRQGVIANDVQTEAGFLSHALLPETRSEMAVPMIVGNQVIGVLDVQSDQVDNFTTQDINIQTTLASQVATALQNARLFSQTEKRAAELATINTIGQVASSQLDLAALVEAAGQHLQETFDAFALYIALFDEQTQMISFPYFHDKDEGTINMPARRFGQDEGGFTAQIIESRRPLLLEVPSIDEALKKGGQVAGSGPITDVYMGGPMIIGDTILGVIGMSTYREIRLYNESDLNLLMTLAGTIGVAIQNAQQFDITRRRAERERIVNEITRKIQSALSMENALQTAVKELGHALGAQYTQVELSLDGEPESKPSAHAANGGNGSRRKAGQEWKNGN